MQIQSQIEQVLKEGLQVCFMQIINESTQHAGDNPESHFKLILVAEEFTGLSQVKRHQAVYKLLKDLMPQFHALALHTFSPEEWAASPTLVSSPACLGAH